MVSSPRHRRLALAPLLVLALLFGLAVSLIGTPPATAAGTNYYVDSANGSDSNSGTSPSTPWRTFANVNNRTFGPGDVINLARGSTWTGPGGSSSTLTVNGAGASGSPITVQPYGSGNAPILRNPSSTNSHAVLVRAPWTVVQGLMVREARDTGIFLYAGADHGVVRDNEATLVGVGVQVSSQYNLVTGNYIHDLTMVVNDSASNNDYGANGVLMKASNNEVSSNRFVNCKASSIDYGTDGGGVEFYGTVDNVSVHHNYSRNTQGFIEVGGGSARNAVVAYNTIIDAGQVIGLHLAGPFASVVSNFQFANNTVVNSSGYSLGYIDGTPSSAGVLVLRNNIFQANNLSVLIQGSSVLTHDHNLYYFTGSQPNLNYSMGTGERVIDPMFANPAAGDYHLRSGSPAIDAGAAALFAVDCDGKAVPTGNGVDIGAYEYGGQATLVPTTAPTPVPTAVPTSVPTTAPTPIPTAPSTSGRAAVDSFDAYAGDTALQSAWRVASNTQAVATLNNANKFDGAYGLSLSYTFGTYNYAGLTRSFATPANWAGTNGLAFWLKPDGSGRSLRLQFRESGGEYWETACVLSGSAATTVFLPFASFAHPGWYTGGTGANGVVDLGAISQISLYVNQDATATGSGTLYVDALQATTGPIGVPAPTAAPTASPAPTAVPTAIPVPTNAPTATPVASSMLQNGSFDSTILPWILQVTAPASARVAIDSSTGAVGGSSARVSITASYPSASHYIQFRQGNLNLTAGRPYQVSFWAKASGKRTISVVLQGSDSPYALFMNQNLSLTTSWQKFTFTATPSQTVAAFLGFNLASSKADVWIDGVSIVPS